MDKIIFGVVRTRVHYRLSLYHKSTLKFIAPQRVRYGASDLFHGHTSIVTGHQVASPSIVLPIILLSQDITLWRAPLISMYCSSWCDLLLISPLLTGYTITAITLHLLNTRRRWTLERSTNINNSKMTTWREFFYKTSKVGSPATGAVRHLYSNNKIE